MTTWTEIEQLVTDRWHGHRRYQDAPHRRGYDIPSPTGGTFLIEVTLRPRWCALAIDRWRTTDRSDQPSGAWLAEHVWPVVEAACAKNRRHYGVLPTGGGCYSSAHPIERADLLPVLTAWVDQELTWGLAPSTRVDRLDP